MTLLRRRLLQCSAALACPSVWAQAGTVPWLITPEEARQLAADLDAPLFATRAAGAPVIEVLRPTVGEAALPSPVPIELAFKPAAGASIAPESFRVFYGVFKLDLTQRLLASVKVQPGGLRVEQAAIPSGQHRLVMQISDTEGRTGTRELRFSVA